jgi:hypothetical protein
VGALTKPGAKSSSNRRGAFLDGMGGPEQFRNSDAVIATAFKLLVDPAAAWDGKPRNRQERRSWNRRPRRR